MANPSQPARRPSRGLDEDLAPALEKAKPGKKLRDLDAVKAMSTDEIKAMLANSEAAQGANKSLLNAAFEELVKRHGMAYARKVAGGNKTGLDAQELEQQGPAQSGSGERISVALQPENQQRETKDAASTSTGATREESAQQETDATAKAAGRDRPVKRKQVEESLSAEEGGDAWGHVSYWVLDEAEVMKSEAGYGLKMHVIDLHTQVHLRPPGDPSYADIADFAGYFGGSMDTGFAEYQGILLHEQQHVREVQQAWQALFPAFVSRIEAIRAGSAAEARQAYRDAFHDFDEQLFLLYFASGEANARSIEWSYYHEEYERRYGKPPGAKGSAASAASEGAAQGRSEAPTGQAAGYKRAAMGASAGAERPVTPLGALSGQTRVGPIGSLVVHVNLDEPLFAVDDSSPPFIGARGAFAIPAQAFLDGGPWAAPLPEDGPEVQTAAPVTSPQPAAWEWLRSWWESRDATAD